MALPSRKKIAIWIFVLFILSSTGAVVWYLMPSFIPVPIEDPTQEPNRVADIFPFGNNTGSVGLFDSQDPEIDNLDEQGEPTTQDKKPNRMPRMRQISEGPVIGAFMIQAPQHSGVVGLSSVGTTDKEIQNTIRYIELGTGHVYETSTADERVVRISNTTVPRINEVYFVDKDHLLIRYANEQGVVKTFQAELIDNFADGNASPQQLQGVFLEDNIIEVAVSPSKEILTLKTNGDSTRFHLNNIEGDRLREVYTSPINEWQIDFGGNSQEAVVLASPSYNTHGTAYILDVTTGAWRPYLSGYKALQVLTSDTHRFALLSSRNSEEKTQTYIWDSVSQEYTELSLATFTEKCAWAQKRELFYCAVPSTDIASAEPDLWYQGVTKYQDRIYQVDPHTGVTRLVIDPLETVDHALDIIDFAISPDEQFLYFRDKTSRSLWSVQIDYDRMNQSEQAEPEADV